MVMAPCFSQNRLEHLDNFREFIRVADPCPVIQIWIGVLDDPDSFQQDLQRKKSIFLIHLEYSIYFPYVEPKALFCKTEPNKVFLSFYQIKFPKTRSDPETGSNGYVIFVLDSRKICGLFQIRIRNPGSYTSSSAALISCYPCIKYYSFMLHICTYSIYILLTNSTLFLLSMVTNLSHCRSLHGSKSYS